MSVRFGGSSMKEVILIRFWRKVIALEESVICTLRGMEGSSIITPFIVSTTMLLLLLLPLLLRSTIITTTKLSNSQYKFILTI